MQVERIRKRHKGNEQAVDMLKVRIVAVYCRVDLEVRAVDGEVGVDVVKERTWQVGCVHLDVDVNEVRFVY